MADATDDRRRRSRSLLLISATIPLCWYLMMLVHEFGHALGAWATGGTVQRLVFHPLAISRTDVSPNPFPILVAWAGPVLGVLLPLAVWLVVRRIRPSIGFLARFFAGFCCVANGAYIGAGAFEGVGDAGEMLALGSPFWLLPTFGLVCGVVGLTLWHGLGRHFGWGNDPLAISAALAAAAWLLLVLIVAGGFLFGSTV